MTNNWRSKLEETTFQDLNSEEQADLIQAMELDQDLRKQVISDLRFESVLRETLRTEENPEYKKELAEKWSKERIYEEMDQLGMDPKPLQVERQAGSKLHLVAIALFVAIVFMVVLIFQQLRTSESDKPSLVLVEEPTKAEFMGQMFLERKGEVSEVKQLKLLNGDILSTNETGWGHITLEEGVFIELGRHAKVRWKVSGDQKEIELLAGALTATFARHTSEKSVALSTAFMRVDGQGFKLRANHMLDRSRIELLEGRAEVQSTLREHTEMIRSGEAWKFHQNGSINPVLKDADTLDKDLVAWWSMDDGQGKTINDFSGSGFQGSLASHVKLVEGLRGKALKISDINRQNLVIPHSPELNIHPENGITVMAWIKTSRTEIATILDKRYGEMEGGKYFGYQMVLVEGKLSFQMDDGRTLMFRSKKFVADGTWHHICVSVTRKGKELGTFYVDGEASGTFDTSEIGNTDSPGSLNIGGHVDLDHHAFVGYIDEVRVYRRGLNKDEIQSLMNRSE